VHVSDDAAEAVCGTDGAVVGSLGAWVAIVGPAERPGGELGKSAKKSVLLLYTEPWLFSGNLRTLKDFGSEVSEVGVVGSQCSEAASLPDEALAHDEHVVTLTEGITEVRDRLQDDLGVLSGCLISGGAVVVPLGKVCERGDLMVEGLAL